MLFSRRDLTRLLAPLIVEQLLAVLVGMVDVLMVAAVGEMAVSGVALVDSISMLVIQVLAALATGGAVVCSQYIGQKREDLGCVAAGQLVMITAVFSLVIAGIALFGGRHLLRLIFGSVEADVMDNAARYFRITSVSYPFLAMYNSSAALFRSMGNSRMSMLVSLQMNLLNILGNALCVFGFHMGVEGVAYPTLFSRMYAALVMMVLLQRPANVLRIPGVSHLKPRKDMIGSILSIAIPSGVESGVFQFGKIMVQSLVSTLGTASIAAFAVASNLVTFQYLPGNAMGLGLITIVGQCVGAGENEQAKRYTWKIILADYAALVVICGVMALARGSIVSIYHLSPEASAMAESLLLLHCCMMIVWPFAFPLPNTLRAGLDAKFTMLVSVCSMWIFRIGGAYLFVKGLGVGLIGVWMGMFVDWVFRASMFLWRFRGFSQRARRV